MVSERQVQMDVHSYIEWLEQKLKEKDTQLAAKDAEIERLRTEWKHLRDAAMKAGDWHVVEACDVILNATTGMETRMNVPIFEVFEAHGHKYLRLRNGHVELTDENLKNMVAELGAEMMYQMHADNRDGKE